MNIATQKKTDDALAMPWGKQLRKDVDFTLGSTPFGE